MAFGRVYSLEEVKGILQFYRDNCAITARNLVPGVVLDVHMIRRSLHPAHAYIHGGADLLMQQDRVNTPGEPRNTGTYWTEDDQANATLEALNSAGGQLALGLLDTGAADTNMEADLTPNRIPIPEVRPNDSEPLVPRHRAAFLSLHRPTARDRFGNETGDRDDADGER